MFPVNMDDSHDTSPAPFGDRIELMNRLQSEISSVSGLGVDAMVEQTGPDGEKVSFDMHMQKLLMMYRDVVERNSVIGQYHFDRHNKSAKRLLQKPIGRRTVARPPSKGVSKVPVSVNDRGKKLATLLYRRRATAPVESPGPLFSKPTKKTEPAHVNSVSKNDAIVDDAAVVEAPEKDLMVSRQIIRPSSGVPNVRPRDARGRLLRRTTLSAQPQSTQKTSLTVLHAATVGALETSGRPTSVAAVDSAETLATPATVEKEQEIIRRVTRSSLTGSCAYAKSTPGRSRSSYDWRASRSVQPRRSRKAPPNVPNGAASDDVGSSERSSSMPARESNGAVATLETVEEEASSPKPAPRPLLEAPLILVEDTVETVHFRGKHDRIPERLFSEVPASPESGTDAAGAGVTADADDPVPEEPPQQTMETEPNPFQEIDKLDHFGLQTELKLCGLFVTGNKSVLRQRLREYYVSGLASKGAARSESATLRDLHTASERSRPATRASLSARRVLQTNEVTRHQTLPPEYRRENQSPGGMFDVVTPDAMADSQRLSALPDVENEAAGIDAEVIVEALQEAPDDFKHLAGSSLTIPHVPRKRAKKRRFTVPPNMDRARRAVELLDFAVLGAATSSEPLAAEPVAENESAEIASVNVRRTDPTKKRHTLPVNHLYRKRTPALPDVPVSDYARTSERLSALPATEKDANMVDASEKNMEAAAGDLDQGFDTWPHADMKEECRRLGLSVMGTKLELSTRLYACLTAMSAEKDAAPSGTKTADASSEQPSGKFVVSSTPATELISSTCPARTKRGVTPYHQGGAKKARNSVSEKSPDPARATSLEGRILELSRAQLQPLGAKRRYTAGAPRGTNTKRQKKDDSTLENIPSPSVIPAAKRSSKPRADKHGYLNVRKDDILNGRYKILNNSKLGEGNFGRVHEVIDVKNPKGPTLALKISRCGEEYRRSTAAEIAYCDMIARKDPLNISNCLKKRDDFVYPTDKPDALKRHPCIVFDKLGTSVFDFLQDNGYHPYPVDQIGVIVRDALTGTAFMHKEGMTHADLKPENLLFVSKESDEVKDVPLKSKRNRGFKAKPGQLLRRMKNASVRLIDFGTVMEDAKVRIAVESKATIQTSHYRAPEVVMKLNWNKLVDIWSIGCIAVELYTGQALFHTEDDKEHLCMMERILGPIPPWMKKTSRGLYNKKTEEWEAFFEKGQLVKWTPNQEQTEHMDKNCLPLKNFMRKSDEENEKVKQLFDFVKQALQYDPSDRPSAADLLRHPFFSRLSG